jgi:low affinity Fe/Cu permease
VQVELVVIWAQLVQLVYSTEIIIMVAVAVVVTQLLQEITLLQVTPVVQDRLDLQDLQAQLDRLVPQDLVDHKVTP